MFYKLLKQRQVKSYLINPDFQLSFLARIFLLTFINFAIIYGIFRYQFHLFYLNGKAMNLPPQHAYFQMLDQQLASFHMTFVVLGLATLLVGLIGGIILSHRVAGPLYRLRQHMDAIASGATQDHVQFRKKDYFKELADSFNKQLDKHKRG